MTMTDVKEVRVTRLDEDGNPTGPTQTFPVTDVRFARQPSNPDTLHALRTVSLLEAARLLGIGRTKAYQLHREGTFPVRVREIAGALRVRLKDIEDFLDT
jgi:hypothetical protein